MSDVASAVKDRASDLASSVASKAGDAWDSTKQAASSVASTAEDTWEEVSRFMRRYPIATFCVGVGVGVLLAQLMEGQGFSLGGRGSRDWGSYFSDFRSPFQQSERPDRERDFSYQGRA